MICPTATSPLNRRNAILAWKDYSLDDNPGRIIGILAAMIEQRA
ncbi:hypothetical protein [Candidatus Electronema sp. PJ]